MNDETCPKCHSNVDYYDGFCVECGYDSNVPEASPEEIASLVSEYDKWLESWSSRKRDSFYSSLDVGFVAGPYKPYVELADELKKWPIWINDTDHWGNRAISWIVQKTQGVNILNYPKAVGPFIWIPKWQQETKSGYCALAHEGRHAKDFWLFGGPLFYLSQYVLPYGPCFTALWEYRGYVETMRANLKAYGYIMVDEPKRYAEALASKPYRYCWPWPKVMQKWFEKAKKKLEAT